MIASLIASLSLNSPVLIALLILDKLCHTILPAPIFICPTSLLPICPSGSPTYSPDAPSVLKPYLANSKNGYKGIKCKYQITARDVATGSVIVVYCEEKSVTYTRIFLEQILYPFLKQFKGLDLKKITIQTDNGSEFTNRYIRTDGKEPEKSTFTIFIEDKFRKHRMNIPGNPTSDSDVETFHWSIERDCLAWDDIVDEQTLIKYTTEYIKEYMQTEIKTRGYSPLEKIKETYDIDNIIYPMPQILHI